MSSHIFIGDTMSGLDARPCRSRPLKARLVITALFVDKQTPAEVAARYGVHRAWVCKLKASYQAEGDDRARAAVQAPQDHTERGGPGPASNLIRRLRKELTEAGLDAGSGHHRLAPAITATRYGAAGHDQPDPDRPRWSPRPKKRPKSSYIRFEATMPNETWQSDFTHYRLTNPDGSPGVDVESLTSARRRAPATPCHQCPRPDHHRHRQGSFPQAARGARPP